MRPPLLFAILACLFLPGCALFGITSKVEVDHPLHLLESGVQYREIVMGQGPPLETGQAVTIDYTGFLADGSVFDSSLERGLTLDFVLGDAPLPGWNEALVGMRAGGRRHISIPPELAYGEAGVEGLVPPNETLVFEIWLLEIR